jgi:hypothetical protein
MGDLDQRLAGLRCDPIAAVTAKPAPSTGESVDPGSNGEKNHEDRSGAPPQQARLDALRASGSVRRH